MSNPANPPDPTVPPQPQVRRASRGVLVFGAVGVALLFFVSTVFLNKSAPPKTQKPALAPQSSPASVESRINSLLDAAVRDQQLDLRKRREEEEQRRALDQQLGFFNSQDPLYGGAGEPTPQDYTSDPAGYGPSAQAPPYSAEASQTRPQVSPAEARLEEAYQAPILAQTRPSTAKRSQSEPTLDEPSPMADLSRLLAPLTPRALLSAPATPEPAKAAVAAPQLAPVSHTLPNTLLAGSVIPATLTSRIISDLPGTATAMVSADVYDTLSGKVLLIPRGSRLFGRYNSDVGYGQNRLAVSWSRLTLPNGIAYQLDSPSADSSGAAGLADRVDRHLGRLYGSALLLSVFSAGAQLSQPGTYGTNRPPTASEIGAGAMGQRLQDVSSSLLEREMRVPPTIAIDPGTPFSVVVTTDLVIASVPRSAR